MQENKKAPENFQHDHFDLEQLKKEAGFTDFTKLNALRIASRVWISEKGFSLKKCIENKKEPYALIGFYLGSIRIDNRNQLELVNEHLKPNIMLFFALKEYMCGKIIDRYNEFFPPFIIKAQYIKPLAGPIFRVLNEQGKDIVKYPWLITYNANLKGKLFEVGALTKEKKLENYPIYKDLEIFKNQLRQKGVKSKNGILIISPKDFDESYKIAFEPYISTYIASKEFQENKSQDDFDDILDKLSDPSELENDGLI